jgi:pimeloyl-ACP methyl ester carboxylesterase
MTTRTTPRTTTTATGRLDLYVEQHGTGPDVLLLAGLGDTVEAWQFQVDGLRDHYRLTTFDNRGAGRSPMPDDGFSVASMADDAADVLRSLGIGTTHVAGFSGGTAIAQELALRHPELVRSLVLMGTWARMDAYMNALARSITWMVEAASSEREFLEAFFLWIYTARAHEDGTVDQIIEEALGFEYGATPEGIRRQLEVFARHDTVDRLHRISVPTLVLAGGQDLVTPPRLGRVVADLVPGAAFEVWPEEAHQPFQEVPDAFNRRVAAFWREVDSQG